jgi:hypothetical protein
MQGQPDSPRPRPALLSQPRSTRSSHPDARRRQSPPAPPSSAGWPASRKLAVECRNVCRCTSRNPARRERLEPSKHVARFQRCPDLGGEDQVAVPPFLSGRELFRGLLDPLRAPYLDRRLGDGDGPAAGFASERRYGRQYFRPVSAAESGSDTPRSTGECLPSSGSSPPPRWSSWPTRARCRASPGTCWSTPPSSRPGRAGRPGQQPGRSHPPRPAVQRPRAPWRSRRTALSAPGRSARSRSRLAPWRCRSSPDRETGSLTWPECADPEA